MEIVIILSGAFGLLVGLQLGHLKGWSAAMKQAKLNAQRERSER